MSIEEHEVPVLNVQEEVTGLKTQMNKILEMLGALTQNQANQSAGPSQPPVLTRIDPENPTYGLPRSFIHPTATQTETFTFPITQPSQPVITPTPQPIFITSTTPPLTNPIVQPGSLSHPHAGSGVERQVPLTISPAGRPQSQENSHHVEYFVNVDDDVEPPPTRQMYKLLADRLKMVEKSGDSTLKDLSEFYLVTDFTFPPEFKLPTFTLFNGYSCPNEHMTMYLRRMASYAGNDKLLIHCFQESLTGAATKWYNSLERSQVSCFRDLAEAFVRYYKCNTKSAPTRLQLQSMNMKKDESFRDYAQRWRMVATQVDPPLSESEMISTFVRTLQEPYYKNMLGVVALTYSDMLIIGERIDEGIQMGKVEAPTAAASAKKSFGRENESEVHAIDQPKPRPLSLPAPVYKSPSPNQGRAPQPQKRRFDRVFTPLHVSLSDLLPGLIENRLVELLPAREIQPPFTKRYDPDARCAYHSGMAGHSTDKCFALRNKVQDLIEEKWIDLSADAPATSSDPFPQHSKE